MVPIQKSRWHISVPLSATENVTVPVTGPPGEAAAKCVTIWTGRRRPSLKILGTQIAFVVIEAHNTATLQLQY